MILGPSAHRGPHRSCIPSDTLETLSFNSRTPKTSTPCALPITSLGMVVFLEWYVRCIPLGWCLRDLLQVGALLDDYPNTLVRATNFDSKLTTDALAVTPQNSDYAGIVTLSVRQLFGNIELTTGWDGLTYVQDDVMAFLRGTQIVSAEFSSTD